MASRARSQGSTPARCPFPGPERSGASRKPSYLKGTEVAMPGNFSFPARFQPSAQCRCLLDDPSYHQFQIQKIHWAWASAGAPQANPPHSRHQDPIWVSVPVLLYFPSLLTAWESSKGWPKSLRSCIWLGHLKRLQLLASDHLQPTAAIWWVNQQVEIFCLSSLWAFPIK